MSATQTILGNPEAFEPHDLECPALVVDTTDGYEPDLEAIVGFVART